MFRFDPVLLGNNVRSFNTESEAKEYYKREEDRRYNFGLSKDEATFCLVNGEVTIIQGTPLAFDAPLEDLITAEVESEIHDYDKALEIAKNVVGKIYDELGIKTIFVSIEY